MSVIYNPAHRMLIGTHTASYLAIDPAPVLCIQVTLWYSE